MPPKTKERKRKNNNRSGRFRPAVAAARSLQKLGTATEFLRAPHSRYDTIENSMPVFPAVKRARLNYHTHTDLFCGASGVCGTYVFAANGLYDPDITGTGHQPIGFDQMMFFYYHYTVVRTKISVDFRNNSGSVPCWCAVSRNSAPTVVTIPDELIESGNIEYRRINQSPDWDCFKRIVIDMDVGQFAGVPNLLDNSDFRGSNAANPVEIEYFHLSVWNTTIQQLLRSIVMSLSSLRFSLLSLESSPPPWLWLRRGSVGKGSVRKCVDWMFKKLSILLTRLRYWSRELIVLPSNRFAVSPHVFGL